MWDKGDEEPTWRVPQIPIHGVLAEGRNNTYSGQPEVRWHKFKVTPSVVDYKDPHVKGHLWGDSAIKPLKPL